MKDLILIENEKYYQFDSLEGMIGFLLGDNYFNISKEEQLELMDLNARANCINTNLRIVKLDELADNSINNMFVIHDEKTYVLSLLIINRYKLLEKTTSNIFTQDLNKDNIEDNYIIVNKFSNELLKKYIAKIKGL